MLTETARSPSMAGLTRWALPIGFVLLWSSGFLVGTVGARGASPLALTFWRFVLAAGALATIALVTGAPWPRSGQTWRQLAMTGVLLQAVQFIGVYLGLALGVPAGLSSLVLSASPLLVASGAVTLFGDRLTARQWLGSALGLAGVAVAASDQLGEGGGLAGLALTALGLAGFSAGTLYQKRHGAQMDLRTGGAIQLGAATLVTAPVAVLDGGLSLPLTGPVIGALGWLALVNSVGAVSLLFVLLRSRRSGTATSLLYLVPPVTAVLAVPFLHQPLTVTTIAGLAITATGVTLVTRAAADGPGS